MSDIISFSSSSSFYLRCRLKCLPSRSCPSSTWRRALPCSWPSGLLIAWLSATRSSVWRWNCCQRSWSWRRKKKRVNQRPELSLRRRVRRWGCYCGLELPTCSRVTVTHTWKTGNRLWLTTRGIWQGVIFIYLINIWFETQACTLPSRCTNLLVRVHFKQRGEHFASLSFFFDTMYCYSCILCRILFIFVTYRLPSTDAWCRCGCTEVWNTSVCPKEAEGAFVSWEGHQFLTDRATERGAERLAAQPACITRYSRASRVNKHNNNVT